MLRHSIIIFNLLEILPRNGRSLLSKKRSFWTWVIYQNPFRTTFCNSCPTFEFWLADFSLLSCWASWLLFSLRTLQDPQIIKHRWSDWDVTSLGVYFFWGGMRGFAQLSPAIQHAQFKCKQIQQYDSVSSLIICVLLSVVCAARRTSLENATFFKFFRPEEMTNWQ